MVNKMKITYFPLIDNHRTALFYPTDSCRYPSQDILIATRADFSMGGFGLSPGLDRKKVSLNASKVGNHLSLFLELFEKNLPHQMTGLNDLGIGNTIINIDALPPA
jgi:hypothetical protein